MGDSKLQASRSKEGAGRMEILDFETIVGKQSSREVGREPQITKGVHYPGPLSHSAKSK